MSKKCPTCGKPTPNFLKLKDGHRIPDLCNACRESFKSEHQAAILRAKLKNG